jgi:hypothetical protein
MTSRVSRPGSRALAAVAVVFGLATLAAGGRVLWGADPGYVVFRPLLVFNTAMGAAYVLAGLLIWRDRDRGRVAAAALFGLNLLVLAVVVVLYWSGSAIAIDSVRAMAFRTAVWLALFLGLWWLGRGQIPGNE